VRSTGAVLSVRAFHILASQPAFHAVHSVLLYELRKGCVMRKMGVLGVVLVLLLLLVGVNAWGLSICEYHSPKTALTDARLSFGYRYYDDANTADIDVNSGRLGFDYDQLFDSPNYGFSLAGAAELTLNDFLPTEWLGQGAATFRYYPIEKSLLFAFGGLEALLATGQPRPGVDVKVGGGIGRFSDVTPLAKAITMEEKLLELNALTDPIADDVLLSIAAAIGRRIEYDTLKDLVAEIETLIEGAAGVELDARALLTIEEVILLVGDERRCGWAIQAGIGYELLDPYGGDQNVVVGGSADAAFAFGPNDQLVFHASYSGPFDIMNENTLSASVSYEYAITEESTIVADYVLQRVKPAGLDATASHSAGIALGFDISGIDVFVETSFTRSTGDSGWSTGISVSAAMDLL